MYPIRFEPIYQDYVWGGDQIASKYRRKISKSHVAESWEIADRDEGMSVVVNGPYKGKTLQSLFQELGEELVGHGQKFARFPLLLKIIDAKENLSIQVHPSVQTASSLSGEPKTEVWVALDAGSVYAGFKKETAEKEFLDAIKANRAEKLLEQIDLHRGEVVYVPGGRVHSICGGSLIYEIQQNSNTTYRLYDWGRKGRDLHLKEGIAAIDWNDKGHAKIPPHYLENDLHHQVVILASTPYFIVERIDIFDHLHIAAIPKTFQIFFCLEGEAIISVEGHQEPLHPGITYLLPAASKLIEIKGKCEILRVRLP